MDDIEQNNHVCDENVIAIPFTIQENWMNSLTTTYPLNTTDLRYYLAPVVDLGVVEILNVQDPLLDQRLN